MFLPPSHSPHLQDQHTISKGEDIDGTFERKIEHPYNISGKPKEVDPMKRTLMIITVALVLCLCGCSEVPQISDIPSEPSQSESLPIKDSEEIFQETDAPQSSVDIDTPEESSITSETTVPDVKKTESTPQAKEETRATGDSVTTSPFEPVKPSSEPAETKVPETTPVVETPKETEAPKTTEAPKEPEPPAPPVETEPEPEPEPEPIFDINYWISYAQGVAVSKGLTLESSAVDCWDNPITANPDCIYLERDINSRMSRYAKDEDITDVWIWYECVGTNSYLIYVGYA